MTSTLDKLTKVFPLLKIFSDNYKPNDFPPRVKLTKDEREEYGWEAEQELKRNNEE